MLDTKFIVPPWSGCSLEFISALREFVDGFSSKMSDSLLTSVDPDLYLAGLAVSFARF